MVASFQSMNMIAGFCCYKKSSIEAAGTPAIGLLLHMGLTTVFLLHMGLATGFLLHMGF